MKERCYRRDYQERHDIDWFASYKHVPIHVASNGGSIPKAIKRRPNKEIQRWLAIEEGRQCEVIINQLWISELKNEQDDLNLEIYLQSFIEFARKGFVSIDNAVIEEEHHYKIVAYPRDKSDLFKQHALPIIKDVLDNVDINLWNE